MKWSNGYPQPEIVLRLQSLYAPKEQRGAGLTLINFNTAAQTLRCLESLRRSTWSFDWIMVLDNDSQADDWSALCQGCSPFPESEITIFRSTENLGFAAGSNFLIESLLLHENCRYIVLLNNDAIAQPGMLEMLINGLNEASGQAGLAGGRMHQLFFPERVDTLGISLYASLMPADRKVTEDPFLGPTGGCCIFSRALVEHIIVVSGYFFDPRYFCYCEDTDLVLRAILLGYKPIYVDKLVAFHEGQASSSKGFNSFITYHGIRNSIWMHAKLMPGKLLAKYGLLLITAHLLTLFRYILTGKWVLMLSIYKCAIRQLPNFWRERSLFLPHIRISWRQLDALISPRFYRHGYLQVVLGQMKQAFSR